MRYLALFLACFALPVWAEDYRIVTSIAPVQGIVADIATPRITPELLVPAGADPHDFALRPSQIRALQNADLIVLAGNGMEPWWDAVAGQISPDTTVLILGELAESQALALPLRGDETLPDPHMWLSPEIAQIWAASIAETLSMADPEGAADYENSLARLQTTTQAAAADAAHELEALADVHLVMGHDSLQYFEASFGLRYGGALSDGHGTEAGAQGVALVAGLEGETCLVIDINEAHDHGHDLLEDAAEVDVDPLGSALLGQPDFTASLFASLAHALEGCGHGGHAH